MEIVLALDQGSSSSRTLAMDLKGSVQAKVQSPVVATYPRDGWVEFSPQALLQSQTETMEAVLRSLPKRAVVVAAGLACQRSTVIFWDAKTGRPVGKAISWQDRRAAALCEGLSRHAEDIHLRTGLLLNPFYSLGKILWVLEHDKKVRDLLQKGRLRIGPVATFLLWHMTRGEVYAVDPTLAQRMLLLNISKLEWDPRLLKLAGVPRESLPRVQDSAGFWCEVKVGGRKIPFWAVLGDQQAAALGLGVDRKGETAANYGTGAFLMHHIGDKPRHVPGLLCSVALKEKKGAHYFLEGTVNAAGTSVEWLRQRLGIKFRDDDLDGLYSRSTHRVISLLAFGGLGAPRWDTRVLSGFFGMKPTTGPQDLVRGTLDSIAFLISDIADAMREAGLEIRDVRVSGGLSRVDGLLQIQSDLLQLPLTRFGQTEATALGVASLAARAAGVGFEVPLRPERTFRPSITPSEAERLNRCWRAFVEGIQSLSRDPRVFEALLEWQEIFPGREGNAQRRGAKRS